MGNGVRGDEFQGILYLFGNLEKISYLEDGGGQEIAFIVSKATMKGSDIVVDFEHPKVMLQEKEAKITQKSKIS